MKKRQLWPHDVYNVETIFFHLEKTQEYEIWVRQAENFNMSTNYGLAWWADPAGPAKSQKAGDKVWQDSNANGVQDSGEPGVENVVVELHDSTGTLLDATTTDIDGNYQFQVDPGSYFIKFVAPFAKGFTTEHAGSDPALDSDADSSGQTNVFTIGATDDFSIDAGLVDLPYGSIGDRVWNDVNNNGIQDSGEPGLEGVEAQLFTAAGDYVSTAFSDSTGHYQFDTVAPGSYFVSFTAPDNYGFSPKGQGSDNSIDSDVNPNGQTDVFTVALAENKTDVDAGLSVTGGTIGDFVWGDADHNGKQGAEEAGISGVTVNLYTSAGDFVAATSTDDDGFYKFVTVPPGSYYITVEPFGDYVFTTKNAGTDNAIDSDVDADGQSDVFTLSGASQLKKTGKSDLRTYPASLGPSNEVRYVHSPIARLAVVYPTLRLDQTLAELPLRKTGLFTKGAQELRQLGIGQCVLGLDRHLTRY